MLVARDASVLIGIHQPDVNACLWLRSLDDSAARELARFASRGDPFESRLELGAHDDLPSRLGLLVAGCIPAELRWALEKDIVELVPLYQRLARAASGASTVVHIPTSRQEHLASLCAVDILG
jgi:hypothetical protein